MRQMGNGKLQEMIDGLEKKGYIEDRNDILQVTLLQSDRQTVLCYLITLRQRLKVKKNVQGSLSVCLSEHGICEL